MYIYCIYKILLVYRKSITLNNLKKILVEQFYFQFVSFLSYYCIMIYNKIIIL